MPVNRPATAGCRGSSAFTTSRPTHVLHNPNSWENNSRWIHISRKHTYATLENPTTDECDSQKHPQLHRIVIRVIRNTRLTRDHNIDTRHLYSASNQYTSYITKQRSTCNVRARPAHNMPRPIEGTRRQCTLSSYSKRTPNCGRSAYESTIEINVSYR